MFRFRRNKVEGIGVKALSVYEQGRRANQEDYLWPAASNESIDGNLFILCDGMGGHSCGEVASQTVCDAMGHFISTHYLPGTVFTENDFQKALDVAYDALDAVDNDAEKKMGTTLTFVMFHGGGCFLAHIGDSRIYQIRPSEKKILYKTKDHSLVNSLLDLGEITLEEAKVFNQKNVITRAMQPHQEHRTRADVANLTDIHPGDYFYMCSDGMLEHSEDEEIVNILSMDCQDQEKAEIFKGATRTNSDNHSAFIIKVIST